MAAPPSKLRTRPPKYGERATSAVCRPGNWTSMPNPARPWTLAAESSRLWGLPMTVHADRGLSVTSVGRGSREAASASSPKPARRAPAMTSPRSTRQSATGTFHFCAAAWMSSVRASAPTCR